MGKKLGFHWEIGLISASFSYLEDRQSKTATQDYSFSLKRVGLNESQELPVSVPPSPERT